MLASRTAALSLCLLAALVRAQPAGWRQDGTGRAPKATPPLKWSATENVDWKVKMPGPSFGTPLLVGARLYVVADPAYLLCLDATDGKEIWRESTSYAEVLGEKKADQIEQKHAALRKARDEASREFSKFRKENPDEKEKIKKLEEKFREADKAMRDWQRTYPSAKGNEGAGRTAATPLWDGKRVIAVFGTGIVAAFSPGGKCLWKKFVEGPTVGFGHGASPVLAAGRVLVHFKDLVALDVVTGKEAWRVTAPARHASPVVAKLGGEEVVIAASGQIVRATDGTSLLKRPKFGVSESTPVLDGTTLYVSQGEFQAFKLSREGDTVELTSLWKAKAARGRRTPSSVVHDGLLYGVTTDGFLDVIDVKTGEPVYRQRLPLPQVYSSPAVAGGHVFVFDTRGKAVVFKTGRKYELVATNQLEGTGASPVFDGKRLYVRGQKHLYCLQAKETGEK